jgi:hypothetical protein
MVVRFLRRLAMVGVVSLTVTALTATLALASGHSRGPRVVTVPLSQSGWYWRDQAYNVGGTGLPESAGAPIPYPPKPGVPSGDLAVAGPEGPQPQSAPNPPNPPTQGPEDETYLEFGLTAIPVGATITSFRITLPVDPSGSNANVGSSDVVACPVYTNWTGGASGASFDGKPEDGCSISSPKVRPSAQGTSLSVDIATIAQTWVQPGGLDFGVAITDNPNNTSTAYQAVFGPKNALERLSARVTYLPPTPAVPAVTAPPSAAAPPAVASTSTTTTGSGPPAVSGAPPTGPAPTVSAATAPIGSSPAVAPPATSRPSAFATTRGAPNAGFWIAGGILLALLIVIGLVLGDPRAPITTVRGRGVSRALHARHLAPAGGPGTPSYSPSETI